jgi:hypothetical protein
MTFSTFVSIRFPNRLDLQVSAMNTKNHVDDQACSFSLGGFNEFSVSRQDFTIGQLASPTKQSLKVGWRSFYFADLLFESTGSGSGSNTQRYTLATNSPYYNAHTRRGISTWGENYLSVESRSLFTIATSDGKMDRH